MVENKHNISVSDRLYKDLKRYCELNNLKLNTFVESLLQKAFNVEKFGEIPFTKFREEESGQESGQPVQIREPEHQIQPRDEYAELLESKKTEATNEPEPKPKRERKITRLN